MSVSFPKLRTVRKDVSEFVFWNLAGKLEGRLPPCVLKMHFYGESHVFAPPRHRSYSSCADWVLYLPLSGESRIFIEGRKQPIPVGTVCLMPPNLVFADEFFEQEYRIAKIGIFDSIQTRELMNSILPAGTYVAKVKNISPFMDTIQTIRNILDSGTTSDLSRLTAAVFFLLLELHRQVPRHPRPTPLRQLARQIEAMPGEFYNLPTLAEKAGMGTQNFIKRFKAEMKMSPMQFVKKCRLNMARWMLSQPDGDVTTVARHTGWKDVNYFITSFRKYTGITPAKFHKSKQAATEKVDYTEKLSIRK